MAISATTILGGGSTDSLFVAGQGSSVTPAQQAAKAVVDASKREINRIKGYKLVLTPAEKHRLAEIQKKIVAIQKKASAGTVRKDELDDKTELLKEADRIIGKPTANTQTDEETDQKLADLAQKVQLLLNPKLDPATEQRVNNLIKIKKNIETSLSANPESATLRAQFQNVAKLVEQLNPPRPISSLSVSEKKEYDDLAEQINATAGAHIQLSARDSIRVAALEDTILKMQENLPPDTSSQPTSAQVSRAYTRL